MSASVQPRTIAEAAFREVIAAYGLVNRFMGRHFADFGISGAKWAVLRTLQRAQAEGLDSLRPADLVDRLLVRPPGITAVVGRLSRQGLVQVTRPIDAAADHRERRIALTPAGAALVRAVLESHADRIATAMSGLSEAEQDQLRLMLQCLNQRLRELVMGDGGTPATAQKRRRARIRGGASQVSRSSQE